MFKIARVSDIALEGGAPGQPGELTRPPIRGRLWPTRVTGPQVLFLTDLVCMSLPVLWAPAHYRGLLAAAVLSCLLFWSADLYRPRLQAFVLDEIPSLLGCLLASTAIVATLSALRHPTVDDSYYLDTATAAIALTLAGRAISNLVIRQARRRQLVRHRSIIVGSGPVVERITDSLASAPDYGLSVVGYLADQPDPRATAAAGTYLGRIRCLRSSIDQVGAGVVLISDRGFAEEELAAIVRQALWNDCSIFMVPRLHELNHPTWKSEMIGSIPVIRFGCSGRGGAPWKCKRAFDIVASTLALLVLAPLIVACAIAVRIDGGPGILFRQTRVGRDGRPFELIKFRSLRAASEQESGTTWSIRNNVGVSRLGRFLRRASLDELPQLWNILRGDMTIVGPRPERPYFVDKFAAEEPNYNFRHRVPAGLTGLAQVNGMRGDTPISERARYDNYYIDNWSLWLDMKVILRTFSEVVTGSGE